MKLYSVCGKKIVSEDSLLCRVCPTLGLSIDDLVEKGIIEATNPTVEDCVRFGSAGLAVVLYEDIHHCDIVPAYNAVQEIKKNFKEQK